MNERRSFFRINDSIAIDAKSVSATDIAQVPITQQFAEASSLQLATELRSLDSENTLLLQQIRESNRAIADYLRNLSRKIELLSGAILQENPPAPLSSRITQVNLSEGGIAFGSAQPFTPGALLALRIIFLREHTGLVSYAEVVRCNPDASGDYQIAAAFKNISEDQQQLIGQQIMRAQMAERRRSKSPGQ